MNCLALLVLALVSGPPAEPSAAAASAPGEKPEGRVDAELMGVFEELDGKVGAIRDVTASFVERKFTALLKKPLVSRGVVRVKGPMALWDTRSPHRSIVSLDKERIRIFYPERKAVEVYDLSNGAGDRSWLNCLPIPRLSQLGQSFTIDRLPDDAVEERPFDERRHVGLRLVPTDRALGRYIERVHVIVDRQSACALRAEMFDADGDRTVIEFDDVKVNTGLEARDVELVVPAGVAESHPLGRRE